MGLESASGNPRVAKMGLTQGGDPFFSSLFMIQSHRDLEAFFLGWGGLSRIKTRRFLSKNADLWLSPKRRVELKTKVKDFAVVVLQSNA